MVAAGKTESGGVELSWEIVGGDDHDETVLLVTGLGGTARRWGELFPAALAERYRVVRFDNRGTGSSGKPNQSWTLEHMAEDAVAVLDAVGAERAHVMGTSMGGMIAQLLALDHRSRVDRLVLLSTHYGGADVVPPTDAATAAFAPPQGTSVADVNRRAMSTFTAPGFAERQPEVIEQIVDVSVAAPTPYSMFAAQLQAIIGSDRSERVRSIDRPTLVVHGDEDPLIPYENGRRLAERIPGARLHTLEDCGHMAMWEMPDRLAEVTLEFLAGE